MFKIIVASDGTGRTADQALMAALTQFPEANIDKQIRPKILTTDQIDEVLAEVKEAGAMLVHTLVKADLREYMISASRSNNIDAIDLMGPMLARLTYHLENSPQGTPGLFFQLNEEYFKRIDSMQFAFTHDDGQRYYDYDRAEIILVGVSRTFKTPLSIYLAFKGLFVANYPIVLGVDPPDILFNLPMGSVFGLTTQPGDLSSLRSVRQAYLGGTGGEYSSLEYVKRELNYAQNIFNKGQWPVINVTSKPVEEIAAEILKIRKRILKA